MLRKYINPRNRFVINLAQQILSERDFSSAIRHQSERVLIVNKCRALNLLSSPHISRQRFATAASTDITLQKTRASKYKEMEQNLKYRENPVIMTLETPQFKSIFTDNRMKLYEIFQKYNYEIRIAGGAVR